MVGPNQRYDKLITLSAVPGKGRKRWNCRCDCGQLTTVTQQSLIRIGRGGHSCGCTRSSKQIKHQIPQAERLSPTYQTWRAMRRRCNDPKFVSYRFYGALGVRVCSEWNNSRTGYQRFVDDMGRRPAGMTLDRKDATGNYEYSNCRWSTADVQATNKRFYAGLAREDEEFNYWSQREEEYLKEHSE